jgi:chlorobactene glucosyltransferase
VILLVLSLAWFAIVVWLILRAINQRGLLPRLAAVPWSEDRLPPRLTIIVPARDEAANIARCLGSLCAQLYPRDRLGVIIVDDHSTDETAAIVTSIAARDARVSLLHCPPLPPRWTGKSHACWVGACAARSDSEWLCFVDADVWGEANLLASAMTAVLERRLALLSLAPRQVLQTVAERIVLPCGLIALSFIHDLRRTQTPGGQDAEATGQFMLIRRVDYDTIGGHAAVSGAICEDLALARRVKHSGQAVLLMGGEDVVSTRMYCGWQTLWEGLAKNLVDTLGGRHATLILAIVGVALAWSAVAIPAADAISWAHGITGAEAALITASLGSAAALGLHVAATRYFRIPLCYGFLFPLGYTAGALIALDSVRRRVRGRVSWKGRIYKA